MSLMRTTPWFGSLSPRVRDALGAAFFCLVLAVMLWRMSHKVLIPGQPQLSAERGTEGMTDFRDAVYYPIRAVLDGVNPYDCETEAPRPDGRPRYRNDPRYPVLNIFPLFSPLILVVFLAFGLIDDFVLSMWCYGAFNIGLLFVFSYALWRSTGRRPGLGSVAGLAGVILITQPGRANFIAGQLALPLTLALFGALHWARNRPWLSALALTIASFKPTFGVPLGLLMLCRRDFRAAGAGLLLSGAIALAGILLVFGRSGDLANIVPILLHNQQELEAHPGVNPATSAARIDAQSVIGRWLGSGEGAFLQIAAPLTVLSLAALVLWKRGSQTESHGASGASGLVIILAVLLSIYHLFYDALPLWIPIMSLLFAPAQTWKEYPRSAQRLLLVLLAVPILNVFCTHSFKAALDRLVAPTSQGLADAAWNLGCTASGLSLSAALLLMVGLELLTKTPGTVFALNPRDAQLVTQTRQPVEAL